MCNYYYTITFHINIFFFKKKVKIPTGYLVNRTVILQLTSEACLSKFPTPFCGVLLHRCAVFLTQKKLSP